MEPTAENVLLLAAKHGSCSTSLHGPIMENMGLPDKSAVNRFLMAFVKTGELALINSKGYMYYVDPQSVKDIIAFNV